MSIPLLVPDFLLILFRPGEISISIFAIAPLKKANSRDTLNLSKINNLKNELFSGFLVRPAGLEPATCCLHPRGQSSNLF